MPCEDLPGVFFSFLAEMPEVALCPVVNPLDGDLLEGEEIRFLLNLKGLLQCNFLGVGSFFDGADALANLFFFLESSSLRSS